MRGRGSERNIERETQKENKSKKKKERKNGFEDLLIKVLLNYTMLQLAPNFIKSSTRKSDILTFL